MDEAGLRRTLSALAGTEAPQARFDVGHAIARGRRHRRIRQVTFLGSALAAGAAVALVIALIVVPRPAALPLPVGPGGTCANMTAGAPTASPSLTPDPLGTGAALAVPPEPFNPLVPCVSFGWLPPGYTQGTLADGNFAQVEPQYTELGATSGRGKFLQMWANAADSCTQTASVVNCGWLGEIGDIALTHPAPAVSGQPAYWTPGCGLLWQYAPSAWALVRLTCIPGPQTPPASEQPVLERIAASVRFGDDSPLVFPFWLDGIPAGFHATSSEFVGSGGVRAAINLAFGPASGPGGVYLTIVPASESTAVHAIIGIPCPAGGVWGAGRPVTVHGAPATVWTLNEPGNHAQRLCASDVDGYAIWADLGGQHPADFGSVTELVAKLHLLGTDPATWTTDPLRGASG